jgi:hypothetical protein
MDEKPQSYAEWLREPDASWPKERLRRSQEAHQNALYVENLALTPTTTVREMQPYGERVGIKVRSKKDFAAVHQAHKELAAEAEGRALESYPHLANTKNYKPKIAKSEPRKKIMGSDKYPRRPAGEPVDDPMVARSADRTYEWGPAEIQRKRFPNQPPLYDPSRGKKIKINRGEEAEVGDHLDDFGMIHQIVKISKDGRTVTTDSPKGRRDHHVSAFAHTFKVPPPTQKSVISIIIAIKKIRDKEKLYNYISYSKRHSKIIKRLKYP